MSSIQELREQMAQQDPEYRRLVDEHQAREQRLDELRRKGWLTAEEEQEVKRLKKEKLHYKDKIESYVRSHTH